MRLRIAHSIIHRYEPPAAGVIQVLRLTPRNHEGQYVIDWRIDVSGDTRLNAHEDAFGNLTHVFAADGPFAELSINVEGAVETQNTDGVVRGTLERFPPSLFLRDTALTQADDAIRDFALDLRARNSGNTLAELHALLNRLIMQVVILFSVVPATFGAATHSEHEETICEHDTTWPLTATAVEAFTHKRGGARDLTHIFLGAARSLQIPARYVAGYLCGRAEPEGGGHAWAEAYVPGLGWVGFDTVNCVCAAEAHVRVRRGARCARRRTGPRDPVRGR
jgi:transglutaminase-like putative cysteine protease